MLSLRKYILPAMAKMACAIGLAVTLAGCAADDPSGGYGAPVETSLKICARESMPSTRAGLGETPALDNEKINSWWVAFVDKNGNVALVASSEEKLKNDPVTVDYINTVLPSGTYTAYSFANITQTDLKDATGGDTGLKFEVGETAPTHESIVGSGVWKDMANGHTGLVPMSGWKEITAKGGINEPYSIEVVRMLAKVEFAFTNATGKDITVNSVDFGHLNKGDIRLMPDYLNLAKPNENRAAPEILETEKETEWPTFAFGDGLTVKANTAGYERGHFYVRESDATSHPTGHFHFRLNITRKNVTEEQPTQNEEQPTQPEEHQVLYALTDELTFINRNDYILIPVRFTDWILEIETLFYPPIGGYPAIMTEQKNGEYYVKFGTQGKFSITPYIREAVEGSSFLPHFKGAAEDPKEPSEYFTVEEVVVESGNNIFKTEPEYDPKTNEFLGELNSNTGTAKVRLRIKVYKGNVTQEYSRTIYIIREDATNAKNNTNA